MSRPRSAALRLLALVACCVSLPGCDDPKREADLRWREEEANAKVVDVARREQEIANQLREIESARMELRQLESRIALREKEVEQLRAEAQRAKVEFETKARRGPAPPTTAARVLVVDAAAPEVPLFERLADKKGAVASTTKIMTGLLLCEAGDLDKIITVEQSDTECAPVRMGIKKGEQYTRRHLLTALMVKSSNDIAQALARDHSGSVEAFVARMNERARELGCKDTLFINPNGLPAVDGQPDPFSTAHDLVLITLAADQMPDLREMVKMKSCWFEKPDGKKVPLENTNRVLRTYEFCDGFKTGYTQAAGYCLVATGEKQGRRRIVIILNGTRDGVWRDAQSLLEWSLKI
jgi:serine-type D-Ala-D-Ala carboxypeptidase (penicillin-binding protein 5/6)